jgi:hypothetical protein
MPLKKNKESRPAVPKLDLSHVLESSCVVSERLTVNIAVSVLWETLPGRPPVSVVICVVAPEK